MCNFKEIDFWLKKNCFFGHRGSYNGLKMLLKYSVNGPKWSPPIPIPGVSKSLPPEGTQIQTKHILVKFYENYEE